MNKLETILDHYKQNNINIIDMIQLYDHNIKKSDVQLYLIQNTVKSINFYTDHNNITSIIEKLYNTLNNKERE